MGSLMYVKEDIILPHTVSFYDLIVNKARGKSGPLFQFDVQEHVVMTFDPRLKSQDAHPGGFGGGGGAGRKARMAGAALRGGAVLGGRAGWGAGC